MFGYIYKTSCKVNDLIYIGKKESSTFIPSYRGSGLNLKKAMKEFGEENFETTVIKWCNTLSELNKCEKYFIEIYKNDPNYHCCNISSGGDGGNTYAFKTPEELDEIKEKISKANRGSNNGNKGQYVGCKNSMFGKHHSLESRFKKSTTIKNNTSKKTTKGYKASDELKQKLKQTAKNIMSLWTITIGNNSIKIYAKRRSVLKKVIPDIYKQLSKIHWLYLKDVGNITIQSVKIEQIRIFLDQLTLDQKNDLQKYRLTNERLKIFQTKNLKGVSTIESPSYEKHVGPGSK